MTSQAFGGQHSVLTAALIILPVHALSQNISACSTPTGAICEHWGLLGLPNNAALGESKDCSMRAPALCVVCKTLPELPAGNKAGTCPEFDGSDLNLPW